MFVSGPWRPTVGLAGTFVAAITAVQVPIIQRITANNGGYLPDDSGSGRRFEGSTLYQVALNPAGVAPEHNKTIKNKYKY